MEWRQPGKHCGLRLAGATQPRRLKGSRHLQHKQHECDEDLTFDASETRSTSVWRVMNLRSSCHHQGRQQS